jgi:hypothetical protein
MQLSRAIIRLTDVESNYPFSRGSYGKISYKYIRNSLLILLVVTNVILKILKSTGIDILLVYDHEIELRVIRMPYSDISRTVYIPNILINLY